LDVGLCTGNQVAKAKEWNADAHRALCGDSELQTPLFIREILG
jgi:hypothetical protein